MSNDNTDLRPLIREALAKGDKSGGVMLETGAFLDIDAVGEYIYATMPGVTVTWQANGMPLTSGWPGLIPKPAPKRRVKGWVNVHLGEGYEPWLGDVHDSKDEADDYAGSERIACIEIDVEEGEGL